MWYLVSQVTFQRMTIPNHYIWLYNSKKIMYMVKWVAFNTFKTFKTLTFAFKTCFPCDHFSRFPRLTLVLTCAMKFNKYPHDEQICKLSMESCKFSSSTKWSFKFEKVKVKNVPNNDESFSQCRTQQMTWYLCGSHQKRYVCPSFVILLYHFGQKLFFQLFLVQSFKLSSNSAGPAGRRRGNRITSGN